MDQKHYENWLALYNDQRRSLVTYASKLTGMRDVAEDIVHDAFVICMARHDRNYEISKPLVLTIIRNLVHNRRRHLAVRDGAHPDDYPWWTKYQDIESPETQVMLAQQSAIAAEVIAALPRRNREVMRLHRVEGMTFKQIAARLKISPTTAHRLMAEAMEAVWRKIDHEKNE